MEQTLLNGLQSIVGKDQIEINRDRILNYLADESPPIMEPKPAADVVVIRPQNVDQISAVIRFANEHRIPVFPRGGGTGLVGGAVPTRDGVVLSLERLNSIEIDKENLMAVAEAGVTLGKLIEVAQREGLSFPPHPGDENAQIGGLVATNAGGSRAVRHGVMRNHVRGIEVVLPAGEILHLGGKVHKDNVAYDLMQLMIGSEGTLGIVTKVTLQLYAKEGSSITLVVPFADRHAAIATVPKILQQAGAPLAIEYVERDLMERSAKHMGTHWPVTTGDYYLIIIVAESTRDGVLSQSLKISEICKQGTKFDIFAAESARDQENILNVRSNLYTLLKPEILDILDIVVPISKLESVVMAIEEISTKYGIPLPVYGHAGDGNLHVHIMRKTSGDTEFMDSLTDEVYKVTTAAGGVITGEHGIGKTRIGKLEKYIDKREFELMRGLKHIFDPNDIMNPGTKIPW